MIIIKDIYSPLILSYLDISTVIFLINLIIISFIYGEIARQKGLKSRGIEVKVSP